MPPPLPLPLNCLFLLPVFGGSPPDLPYFVPLLTHMMSGRLQNLPGGKRMFLRRMAEGREGGVELVEAEAAARTRAPLDSWTCDGSLSICNVTTHLNLDLSVYPTLAVHSIRLHLHMLPTGAVANRVNHANRRQTDLDPGWTDPETCVFGDAFLAAVDSADVHGVVSGMPAAAPCCTLLHSHRICCLPPAVARRTVWARCTSDRPSPAGVIDVGS